VDFLGKDWHIPFDGGSMETFFSAYEVKRK